MSKDCPIRGKAIYMDCLDCDDKQCQKNNINRKELIEIKKYNVLYVDPPWDFSNRFKGKKKIEDGKTIQHSITEKYPTMNIKELKELREFIDKITTKNSVLFMWTTDAHLKSALEVMEAWGYTYKTIGFIWNKKEKSGKQVCYMGMWTMKGSEICLLGTKGNPHKLLKSRKVRQLVEAERGRHSEKPQEVRDRIVEMFGDKAKYLEIFAREKVAPFDVWGNEVNNDV
jgi:site-specific DNA-methyltransferase (adenine-specific)